VAQMQQRADKNMVGSGVSEDQHVLLEDKG
jgi:hypothetical protein